MSGSYVTLRAPEVREMAAATVRRIKAERERRARRLADRVRRSLVQRLLAKIRGRQLTDAEAWGRAHHIGQMWATDYAWEDYAVADRLLTASLSNVDAVHVSVRDLAVIASDRRAEATP